MSTMLKKSATFPDEKALKAAEERLMKSKIVQAVEYSSETGDQVHFISAPGIGKTSFCVQYCGEKGKVVLIHLPTFDVDRAMVAVPQRTANGDPILSQVVWSDLLDADFIILDELARAKPQTSNMIMELVQNKTIGGHPLKEGVTFVACDNHQGMSGVISNQDLAQASRWKTIELSRRDTPWQIALASKYKDVDLTEVFDVYNNLEGRFPGVLDHLQPRTLEHVIWNVLQGHPAIWGLPLMAGPRAEILTEVKDKNGKVTSSKVVTEDVLKLICGALNRPYRSSIPNPMKVAVEAALKYGVPMLGQGEPGIGKTEDLKSRIAKNGINSVYWNLPNIRPDRHIIPFPEGEDRLALWISDQLNPINGEEYVLIADEIWRASLATNNIMLEVTQGQTIGGMKVPMRTVIALTNPAETAGVRQNVGRPDRAMADRFFMSVDLAADDIPAKDWLLETYGDIAAPFIEWYKEDLDDVGRLYTPMRVVERMIKTYKFFQDTDGLDECRPMLGGKYVPVPLHDLKQRLRDRPVARLSAVIANEAEYIRRMKETAVGGFADQDAHIEVSQAVARAELTEIKKHKDALVRIVEHLDGQHLVSLTLGKSGEARSVFSKIMLEATARKRANKAAAAA